MNNETRYPVVIYRPSSKVFSKIKELIMENKFADRNGKAILMKCKEVDNRV